MPQEANKAALAGLAKRIVPSAAARKTGLGFSSGNSTGSSVSLGSYIQQPHATQQGRDVYGDGVALDADVTIGGRIRTQVYRESGHYYRRTETISQDRGPTWQP